MLSVMTAQGAPQPVIEISSNVGYKLQVSLDSEGSASPVQIGSGKFAKVYRAEQLSEGRNIQRVAIKVLHDYADLQAERLFDEREIRMLQEVSTRVNVVRFLDVVSLPPLMLCGCGKLYQPCCTRCSESPPLRRRPQQVEDLFPLLHCNKCGYEISAENIQRPQVIAELRRYPAKRCCQEGINAQKATLINFAERKAVIMEELDASLESFHDRRSQVINALKPRAPRAALERRAKRVLLLEKVVLMVQLADALAWLHQKKIIHKDISPDNIMVCFQGDGDAGERGRGTSGGAYEMLTYLASYPSYQAKLIDFGMAHQDLASSWYEERNDQIPNIKIPYLSPEASPRAVRLGAADCEKIVFETEARRFLVPPGLDVRQGDVLADVHDRQHDHDLAIVQLTPDADGVWAHYQGTPAVAARSNRQFELVRGLGEAHDVYALGAVYYFLLTGDHQEVKHLSRLVADVQEEGLPLRGWRLRLLRMRTSYRFRRRKLREQFWQDELLLLILRAMVRGQPGSFVQSRTEPGPAAQQLLLETKRLHNRIQRELNSTPLVRPWQVLVVMLAGVVLLVLVLIVHRAK